VESFKKMIPVDKLMSKEFRGLNIMHSQQPTCKHDFTASSLNAGKAA